MKQTWAIARNFLLEIWRMRLLVVMLALLLLVSTAGVAWYAYYSSDWGYEKLQTLLSYSLSFIMTILSLLTIFVTIASITRDIKRKEIFTIATKPISRSRYLLGKLLGVGLLNLALLLVAGATVYLLVRLIAWSVSGEADQDQRIRNVVLVARRGMAPPRPDVSRDVQEKVEAELKKQIQEFRLTDPQQIETLRVQMVKEFTSQELLRTHTVPPGGHLLFHFTGLKVHPEDKSFLFLRFKPQVSSDSAGDQVISVWQAGPVDPLSRGADFIKITKDQVNRIHEVAIPASQVSPEGELYVLHRNPLDNSLNGPVSIVFDAREGMELLSVAGSFEANFVRALGYIYLRLFLLAVVSLALGAWLSFPVAALAVLVMLIFALLSTFIGEAMRWQAKSGVLEVIGNILLTLTLNFSAYDPVPLIEKGRLVAWDLWSNLGQAAGQFLDGQEVEPELWMKLALFKDLILCTVIAVVGYVIFRLRELARVIV